MKKIYLILCLLIVCTSTLVIAPTNVFATSEDRYAQESDFLGDLTCGGTQFKFHKSLPNFTATMYDLLKIVTPIIIVVMGMVDMLKAVSAQKEDEIKKAQQKLLRRFIAGVIVFLVFVIVEAVIHMFAEGDDANNAMDCVDCFLKGASECTNGPASSNNQNGSNSSNGSNNQNQSNTTTPEEPDEDDANKSCWKCNGFDGSIGNKFYHWGTYETAMNQMMEVYDCEKQDLDKNSCGNNQDDVQKPYYRCWHCSYYLTETDDHGDPKRGDDYIWTNNINPFMDKYKDFIDNGKIHSGGDNASMELDCRMDQDNPYNTSETLCDKNALSNTLITSNDNSSHSQNYYCYYCNSEATEIPENYSSWSYTDYFWTNNIGRYFTKYDSYINNGKITSYNCYVDFYYDKSSCLAEENELIK